MILMTNQKEQLIRELNFSKASFSSVKNIIKDINKNGINSEYLSGTDASTMQFCIKLSDEVYIYSQQDLSDIEYYRKQGEADDRFFTETIDLSNYTEEDISDDVAYIFGCDLEELKKDYPDDWKQMEAEAIFEQQAMDASEI